METLTKIKLAVTSSAFREGKKIPSRYTCDGNNINPPLTIGKVPGEAESLVLFVEDPDAPGGTFDHWIVWNIPPFNPIEENTVPGIEGRNSAGNTGYIGPCPPHGKHRYLFTIYALDAELHLLSGSEKNEVMKAMENHIIALGTLTGTFEKKKNQ